MEKKETSLKLKLAISFILLFLVISFVTWKQNADGNIIQKSSSPENRIKFTSEEQQERINFLKNGKISIYQCEQSEQSDNKYKSHETGIDISDGSPFGANEIVRYCRKGMDKPGYASYDLISNTEQINSGKDKYDNDSLYDWSIKTRMRIDKEIVFNDPGAKVCTIEILNYEGKLSKSIDIFAMHFIDFSKKSVDNHYYGGEYIEDFSGLLPGGEILKVTGTELNPNHRLNTLKSKLDYRIYWTGDCDMWIDYVKVENQIAEELLKGNYDAWLSAVTDYKIISGLETNGIDPVKKVCMDYIFDHISENNTQVSAGLFIK